MIGRDHRAQALADERLERELRLRAARPHEGDVESSCEHAFERVVVQRLIECQSDLGERSAERPNDLREKDVRRRGEEGDAKLSGLAAADSLHPRQRALDFLEQARKLLLQGRSGARQAHVAARPRKELDAERPLELAHGPRDRGLGQVEPLRGAAEVQLVRDRLERSKKTQVDVDARSVSLDPKSLLLCIDLDAYGLDMEQRTLTDGLEVGEIGYGAMVLIGLYGAVDEERGVAALSHALDRGVTMVDTADAYGIDGSNERLVAQAIADRRDEIVVATKWGIAPPGPTAHRVEASYANEIWIDGRPERAREAAEASLRRLAIEAIDLWYLHFPDPGVPIEETVGAMAALVAEGNVRHLGLSNLTAEALRQAHAVHPIAAVQAEYSLWTRTPERELLPTAAELGVGFVAWGPLGNGFLAGSAARIGAGDFRHNAPRFQNGNLGRNLDRFAPLRELADELELTPAQLALAWLLHQGENIVPIPGSRSPDHIDSNLAAADVRLSQDVLERIDALAPADLAVGAALL